MDLCNSSYLRRFYFILKKDYVCSFDLSKPVAIGSDHAGFEYKMELVKWLNQKGIQVIDMGVYENKSVDYPDYAHPVAKAVEKGESAFGVLLCGTATAFV